MSTVCMATIRSRHASSGPMHGATWTGNQLQYQPLVTARQRRQTHGRCADLSLIKQEQCWLVRHASLPVKSLQIFSELCEPVCLSDLNAEYLEFRNISCQAS